MSADNNGGPAFPIQNFLHHGMTLRDYFAANALAACEVTTENDMGMGFWYGPQQLADRCYAIADAMLKARQS